jgi:predicted transcriptional regulator
MARRRSSAQQPEPAPLAPPALHELEAEIMESLWATGESSVRAVMDALNARAPKPRAYTTYMTVMARLDRKGLLHRRREGKADYYAPAHTRGAYMALRARSEVEGLVEQYGDLALSQFAAQVAGLDPARRRALQRLARGG